jgi:hypothetical protein
LIKGIAKLGYKEIILKSDGEPALISIQSEVKQRREESTILENSPVGDSRSNGVAKRAVRAVGGQARVLRKALGDRLGLKVNSAHPVTSWLVDAADLLSKCQVGVDGKMGCERWKGEAFAWEIAEFGEKVHYRRNKKIARANKLETKWGEDFFLGVNWRTGEAAIGTSTGVGARRRWDQEGLAAVRGWPWKRILIKVGAPST